MFGAVLVKFYDRFLFRLSTVYTALIDNNDGVDDMGTRLERNNGFCQRTFIDSTVLSVI